MNKLLPFLMLLLCLSMAHAQTREVSGKITSGEDGEALPGVNVMIKGTKSGTITDMDGNYKINASADQVLVFSFVGFLTEEVSVGAQSVIDMVLTPDIVTMGEIVVIGYGEKKRRDVIGSVSTISSKDIQNATTPSLENALQGLAAGVQVTQTSGVPGAPVNINIRGVSSINAGTEPLWVIDGMPVYSGGGLERSSGTTRQSPLSMLNPNDIQSIEVLKDASATAIYGSRGSNGVILVTTKSGYGSKGSTSLSYNTGIVNLTRTPEDIGFANTQEWFNLVETARKNSAKTPANPQGVDNPFNPGSITALFQDDPTYHLTREEALNINTNWFDEILQQGSFHDVNLSSQKGFEKGSYYISGNYRDDEGVSKTNRFQRFTARANLNFEPVNNLEIQSRMNFAYTKNMRTKTSAGGPGGNSGGFGNANRSALPWFPVYNSSHYSGYWNPMSGNNLTAMIDPDLMLDQVDQYRGIGGISANYRLPFIKGLSIKSEISLDFIQNNSVNWTEKSLRRLGSHATDRAVTRNSVNYNIIGTYNRTFGDHSFLFVGGTESQTFWGYQREMEGQNLTGTYKQLGRPQDYLSMSSMLNKEEYLRAYLGRGDYKYKDRYLVGFSIRRDGSSNFAPEYRWGTFTAFSAGWILSDEPFFNIPSISILKLRGSYGQTGNKDVNANLAYTLYGNNPDYRYGLMDLIAAGTRVTNIGSPSLTWETTNSYDIGVDYSLLQNRISGSLAYYVQNVTDMLLSSPIPASAGAGGNIWNNIGDMNNYGYEFDIKSVNIHRNDFKWSTDFNVSTNNTKILRLTPEVDLSGKGIISGLQMTKTGGRMGVYFIAEDAGVDPDKGINMIWEIDYNRYLETGETVKTGRKVPATLENLNRNRIIHNDKSRIPKFYGGITNTFEYKGFDLSFLVSFTGGHYQYDYSMQRTTDVQYGQQVLRKDLIGNTWTKPGDIAKYPELRWQGAYDWGWDNDATNPEWEGDPNHPLAKGYWTGGTLGSKDGGNYKNESAFWTKYLFKGDYVRLRSVQIGYTLPKSVADRLRLNSMRISLSGQNLFTYAAEYKGWDPESWDRGSMGDNLPLPKSFNAGLTVQF